MEAGSSALDDSGSVQFINSYYIGNFEEYPYYGIGNWLYNITSTRVLLSEQSGEICRLHYMRCHSLFLLLVQVTFTADAQHWKLEEVAFIHLEVDDQSNSPDTRRFDLSPTLDKTHPIPSQGVQEAESTSFSTFRILRCMKT